MADRPAPAGARLLRRPQPFKAHGAPAGVGVPDVMATTWALAKKWTRSTFPMGWLSWLTMLSVVALQPLDALPHGGGLNADGCHTNKKTGDYHCHGGGGAGGGSYGSGGSSIYIAPASSPKPSKQKPKPPEVSGPVTLISVGDGDTIRVSTAAGQKVTIRLACIDAPETRQGESGAVATGYLKLLVSSGGLEIQPHTVDRYGRTVGEVFAGGRNVNLEMVRAGNAYAYRDYLAGCDAGAYLDAEHHAQMRRLGVWRYGGVQRPWDFRRQK